VRRLEWRDGGDTEEIKNRLHSGDRSFGKDLQGDNTVTVMLTELVVFV
jgi:hypothetical protein